MEDALPGEEPTSQKNVYHRMRVDEWMLIVSCQRQA
jgi:hypothetical protein